MLGQGSFAKFFTTSSLSLEVLFFLNIIFQLIYVSTKKRLIIKFYLKRVLRWTDDLEEYLLGNLFKENLFSTITKKTFFYLLKNFMLLLLLLKLIYFDCYYIVRYWNLKKKWYPINKPMNLNYGKSGFLSFFLSCFNY